MRTVNRLRSLRSLCAAAVVLCCALPGAAARADTLKGIVVGVADGDTITLLDSAKVQHKIRLAGIDAPEKRQAFGEKAKQSLSALVYRQNVVVDFKKKDRYGRIVGKVLVDGADTGLKQVMAGLAWHYKAYAKEQSLSDRERYADEEVKARAAKRGLWADPDAMAPWDFRHR